MKDLVFLDTETTGLDPELHEVWEIAYAINDGPIFSVILPHSLRTADAKSLDLNGYYNRVVFGTTTNAEGDRNDLFIRGLLTGKTIVGANPAFDAAFLRKRWGVAPWHYRMIDLESMALGILGHERPKGLASIADELRDLGYNICEPDHSAWIDVVVLRECYKALKSELKKLRGSS